MTLVEKARCTLLRAFRIFIKNVIRCANSVSPLDIVLLPLECAHAYYQDWGVC